MEIPKLFYEINEGIVCEHKTADDGGIEFHNHDGYEITLLINGKINYYSGGEGLSLTRGNLVCIKPYDFHRKEILSKGVYDRIVINVKKEILEKLSSDKTDLSECFYRVSTTKINALQLDEQDIIEFTLCAHRLIKELESVEYGSDILAEIYLKQILVMVNKISKKAKAVSSVDIMPPLVTDTISYIDRNITNTITLEILSNQLHHNAAYISRCFKQVTGITIQQYIIRKRVTMAKKYLLEGLSPCDACYLSGFNDYSNFLRTFTKQVGLSPSQISRSKLKSY